MTLAIEIPIVFVMVRYVFGKPHTEKILLVAGLASALSLPYLWFIVPAFVDARLYLIWGEIFVVLVDHLRYTQTSSKVRGIW